jgi:SHS2 domain-containing protein
MHDADRVVYGWLEHTSEMELGIEAGSPEAVFTEALVALGDLLGEEGSGVPAQYEVSANASDLPGLLVEWLNELVYLAETRGLIPERIVRMDLVDAEIAAVVAGRRSQPQSLVKGVTYHGLEMGPADGAWRARVVLDV